MAEDANARIRVDIDTAAALANIKNLQRQISAFHTSMAKGGAAAAATSLNMQQGLLNSINQTGKFSATIRNVKSTTDSFTDSLQKNKLSMGEYFRYAGASTKTFGRLFKTEFDTINKVARERVKDLQTQYIKMGRDANGSMRAIAVRPLALDMENLATKTQIAAQRQALLNQLLKQGSTNLLNFGKNTQWAGRQLMVGFTVPLVMLGSVAAKTFMDLEKQAIRFKRVYGEMFTTSGQTEKALADIRELANEFTRYGVAVSKTMELAADIAATGKMGAELNAQVAETTRLAILGGVEQAEALQATISLTDAFGVSADELAGKIDFLNAVENQTITSIEDLTIAIPKAGPVVKQLGGDIEDLTFFLTAMREGGINASESANALKSGLASLINPTRQASDMLAGFGINIKGIVEANAGDVKGLVIDFATALDGLDPLNRARAIEQLFGKFQFSRLSTLFQNVIKDGNQASRVLKLTNATQAELAILSEREMKKIEDSPMFKFQKALEDLKVSLAPVGEAFLKAVTPLLEFGTKVLKKFDELDENSKGFVVGLTAIAGVIGPVFLMGFGLIANGVANIIKMFAFFKASLNKAGSASTQLGMQTEYMTQQQLEASAVAASLDQVHQKLRQTFTSEAAAVNALTAAYQRAIAAQAAMTGGAIARTRPGVTVTTNSRGGRRAQAPQGYASGVISVPGPKGAGDVVPAMLSPGEAVIPAKQAQKYSGFISSMIADNVPGFRFGRNPFASMLGRSQVAVRMKDQDFISELRQSGKNARYKSAFETNTGADYLNRSGSVNEKQKIARSSMERDLFGLDPKTTLASSRPTYGYARTPILSSIVNRLFGGKGKRFSDVTTGTREGSGMERYGNIDLITKNSVAKRSTAYPGDSFMSYIRARDSEGTRRSGPNWAGLPYSPIKMDFPAMRGASKKDQGLFDYRFGNPFGTIKTGERSYSTNLKPPYIETQTPGGFAFREIDKIIARDPAIAKALRQELKAAGLGSVRVTGSNFAARLFKKMGVPGYKVGTDSAQSSSLVNKIASDLQGRQDLDLKTKQRINNYLSIVDRDRRDIPQSLNILSKFPPPGVGQDALARLGALGVGGKDTLKIMSVLADFTDKKYPSTKLASAKEQLFSELDSAPKDKSGLIKKSDTLTSKFRSVTGWRPNNAGGKAFAHLGSGAKLTASEILALHKSGQLKLKKGQIKVLESFVKNNAGYKFDLKTALGMSGIPQSLNAKLDKGTASKSELLKGFANAGPGKWQASVAFGGGKPLELDSEIKKFDSRFEKIIAAHSDDTVFADSEEKAKKLRAQGKNAVSLTSIYGAARESLEGSSSLRKALDAAHSSATEVRASGKAVNEEKARAGVAKNPFVSPGKDRAVKSTGPLSVLKKASIAELLLARRGFRFANGVVSVPGPKGAGDIVPAMLSPGEAVIPAKESQKYAGLIQQMVHGKVPGYEYSNVPNVPGIPNNTQPKPYTGVLAPPSYNPGSIAVPGIPSDSQIKETAVKTRKELFNAKSREIRQTASTMARNFGNKLEADAAAGRGLGGALSRGMSFIGGETKSSSMKSPIGRAVAGLIAAKAGTEKTGAEKSAAAARPNSATRAPVPLIAGGATQQADPDDPNSRKGVMAGKVAGAASAAGMGAMMYGMSGGPGSEIAGMLALPLMMAPMLTNKFALMAAAVVGLVAAFFILQGAINKIRKESTETARSLSSGKDAMATFAEAAGTVAPSEYMEKRREMELSPFVVQSGKTTFGQSFVQSEGGAEIIESFKKQTELFGRSRAIESLQKQLVTAVATGVLSKDQAQSIAQSLGQQLDDYGITANINASINSITGPDGKVIEGNTIQIYTEFIEESTSGVTGTGGILQTEDLTGGAPIWWWDTEKVAKREGEAAGIIANFYDENQQLIDAFDAENLKKIDVLYDQGKYDEALAAEESYQEERQRLVALYAEQTAQVVSDFGGVEFSKQQGILTGMVDLIKERDPLAGVAAEKLRNSTTDTGVDIFGMGVSTEFALTGDDALNMVPIVRALTGGQGILGAMGIRDDMEAAQNDFQEVKVQFLGMLEGGNISTETFNGLMEMFDPTTGEGQATLGVLAKISTDVGPQALGQLEKVFEALDNPDLAAEIAVRISEIEDPEKAAGTINALEQLATFDGQSIEADVVLEFFGAEENFGKLDQLQDRFAQLDDMAKEGKLNLTTLVEQNIITTGDMDALIEDQEFFDGLEPEQQVKYIQVFLAKQEVIAENEIKAWRTANPELSPKLSDDEVADRIANAAAKQYVEDNLFTDNTDGGDEEDSGGGGGPAASSLDDLLKKLRDLRKNQIGVTKGFEASAAAINKLFGGGAGINLFSGIENDMRRLGAEEDLISLIVGMSPEDFEKQKNTLFNFDKQTGEIIGFKDQLQNIGRALSAIALGQYVSDQQRSAKESRNQVIAFNQLRAAGYSVADAYEAVQDAAVASAIATGNVTRDQMNTMLQELKAAQAAMKEAARLTPEGLQEVFEDGFRKAMEAFEVTEKKLTLEYEFKIKDDQALIQNAENQIATIQYQLDDYEADLKGIADQEEAINKTYDDKLEALEKVRVANQKVLDQEKGRLSVAEAITRGDLAATARAVQDLRQTSASGYFTSQTDALNAGRQSALDQVRDSSGLSRIEIEEKIKKLTDEIFKIEEDTLEPAQERIRLAGIELQSRIDEQEVLGKSRAEWETIKNNIDFARVNSIGYKEAMEEARDVVQQVLDAWNGIQSKEVVLTTIQRTIVEGSASSGYTGDGNGDGDGDDDTETDTPAVAAARTAVTQAENALAAWDAKKAELGRQLTAAQTGYASAVGSDRGLYQRAIDGIKRQLSQYDSSDRGLYLQAITSAQNQLNKALNPSMGTPSTNNGFFPTTAVASGGYISGPGTGTSDSIPAMLSNGEYVIKASTVKQFGTKLFDNINAGSLPTLSSAQNMSAPRFASVGSSVSLNQASVPSRQAAASSSNSVYNYSLSVNVASQSDPNTIAQTVMAQLQRVDSQRVRNGRF
jgi:TP901 family phage tail tape measure protein